MAIVIKKHKNELANLDLSPKPISLNQTKERNKEIDKLKDKILPLQDVNDKNIQLALKLKELKQKYDEEKNQHKTTKRMMMQYYHIDRNLNIPLIYCNNLKKEIDLSTCQESCMHGYCVNGYECSTRINNILNHYKIPESYDKR